MAQGLALGLNKLVIRSDSSYSLGAMNKGIKLWKSKGWKQTKHQSCTNIELLKIADLAMQRIEGVMDVKYDKVIAHAKLEGNEVADRLANVGAELNRYPNAGPPASQVPLPPPDTISDRIRGEVFGGLKDQQFCRTFGQLLGVGTGTGRRYGWSNQADGLTCRADVDRCSWRAVTEDSKLRVEMMKAHILAKHRHLFTQPWRTDKYDFKQTGRYGPGGREVLHYVCTSILGQDGV